MGFSEAFRFPRKAAQSLAALPTTVDADRAAAAAATASCVRQLQDLQYLLYAENRRSLLVCLQGMDTSGKDGVIRHVFGPLNPQGVRVQSFKVPSAAESAHDFLWRIHQAVPAHGEIMVFNRSHYEDVLVPRVHATLPPAVLEERYEAINAFERHLANNGTHILKFFLHISPQEQLRRFGKRLKDPARQWKINEADYSARALWDDYQRAYDTVLQRCNTPQAPWFVVPADRKWFRDHVVAGILAEYLAGLGMQPPAPRADMERIRELYRAELAKWPAARPGAADE